MSTENHGFYSSRSRSHTCIPTQKEKNHLQTISSNLKLYTALTGETVDFEERCEEMQQREAKQASME